MMNLHCPVCFFQFKTNRAVVNSVKEFNCPTCSKFSITDDVIVRLENVDHQIRWRLSAWIRQYSPTLFTTTELSLAIESQVPSIGQRVDRMLRWLSANYQVGEEIEMYDIVSIVNDTSSICSSVYFASGVEPKALSLMTVGWNRNVKELRFMLEEVLQNEMGYLTRPSGGRTFQLSLKALMQIEGSAGSDTTIGFCAMWFSDEVKTLWTDVVEPAIRDSGYEPWRIDGKQHNGKIDDEIMASIRSAKFVVADFTGNRGGVYYEAGFAHGLGLPVDFMCREGDELHFDIRQYNCIFWKSDALQEARERLKNRILATLGQGSMRLQ